MNMDQEFMSPNFPRASAYHPDWIRAGVSGGANPLWMTEWLTGAMNLKPGMRVLDLGCGRAMSSIFLHKEFGVQVWATDLWTSAAENFQRISDAGMEQSVFPIHADARSLPFAAGFFDAIISIDSYPYYGTDAFYLGTLARFIKPDGQIGIAGAGLVQEIGDELPVHLREWWTPDLWCLHSVAWWRKHWERSGILDIEQADTMAGGWLRWLDWHHAIAPDNYPEIDALKADQGQYLGYVRLVGRLRSGIKLEEPILSISSQYSKNPLMR